MGKLAMFCVAISVLCSVLTAMDIPTDPKFDPAKLSPGKWYPVLTGSHSQPPPKNVYAIRSEPLSNGAFSARIEIPVNGTCQERKYDLKPTKPGSFKTEDGKALVHVIQTDYNHHLLSIFKTDKENVLQLYAKKTKAPSTWKKKFNNFAKKLHFNSGKVQDLSDAALCTPLLE